MKVVNVGNSSSSSSNYDDLALSKSMKTSKFGTLSYFKNRIYLVQDKPITDYGVWSSDEGSVYLVLNHDQELRKELDCIKEAVNRSGEPFTDVKWKGDAPPIDSLHCKSDDAIFIKMDKNLDPLQLNCELRYTIAVYGVFLQKTNGLLYLQMAVQEHQTTKISLLKRMDSTTAAVASSEMSYQPNSTLWSNLPSQQW